MSEAKPVLRLHTMTGPPTPIGRPGVRTLIGSAQIACPTCGGDIDTNESGEPEQIEGGLRWLGVVCRGCGASYTVEMTEKSEPE